MKDDAIRQSMASIENRVRHVYNQGFEAGRKAERKTGKWKIYVISMLDGEGCRCSECGFEGTPYWEYCPHCGAIMEGAEE